MTEFFLAELEREAVGTRRALERVPEGKNDWKPHAKSMPLGYLAALVAKLPSWIAMMITQDDYDITSQDPRYHPPQWRTRAELMRMVDDSIAAARQALSSTTDEHLMTSWRLRVGAHVASEQPRHVALSNGVFTHLAHHRGQLTVYLRLLDAPVPAIYGPSADEQGGF